jgi:hypothetical protein
MQFVSLGHNGSRVGLMAFRSFLKKSRFKGILIAGATAVGLFLFFLTMFDDVSTHLRTMESGLLSITEFNEEWKKASGEYISTKKQLDELLNTATQREGLAKLGCQIFGQQTTFQPNSKKALEKINDRLFRERAIAC